MLCGTAFKNKGVQRMLDAVIDYLPAPIDIPPVERHRRRRRSPLTRKADDSEKFSALAFKLMTDPYVGQLTFVRVYSGVLNSRRHRLQPDQGQEGAHRPYRADARQRARGNQGNSAPATSPLAWA